MAGYKPGHEPEKLDAYVEKALTFIKSHGSVTRAQLVEHLGTRKDGNLTNKILKEVTKVKGYSNNGRAITYEEPSQYI